MSENSGSDWSGGIFIILLIVLFAGEPDIFDALRTMALNEAGLEAEQEQ